MERTLWLRRLQRWLLVFLVLGALAASLTAEAAPQMGRRGVYFPETGFWVNDPFLRFWENNGGLRTFGYPISRVFYQDGLLRQYFERAIFERHDHLAGTRWEVLATRIGALTTLDRLDEPPFQRVNAQSDANCTFYPESGHTLCNGFRAYWQARGGLLAFGYPISEEFEENGHIVQYFERARFEWHPQNAPPYDILLGHLGHQQLASRPVPPSAVIPEGPAGPIAPLGPQPLYDHPVGCGFNFFWYGDFDNHVTNERYLDLVRDSGCEWIRVQAQWSELEPRPGAYAFNPLDRLVEAARERELRILVSVNAPPGWALDIPPGTPANPVYFERFMSVLASHFKGRVDAWQIWNEPNIDFEAGGLIDAAGYLALLRVAGPAVKAADPDALVVLAALAPNSLQDRTYAYDDIRYLEELLWLNGGEAKQYFDVVGIHAYSAGNHPDHYWPSYPADTPGWNNAPEFYFRHAEEIRSILVSHGLADRPVWITEFGWGTASTWDSWSFGNWISEEDQAAYLLRAFEIARTEWPWVEEMFVWNLNYSAISGEGHPYTSFAVLDADGNPRPAYRAIAEMPKRPRAALDDAPAPEAPEEEEGSE